MVFALQEKKPHKKRCHVPMPLSTRVITPSSVCRKVTSEAIEILYIEKKDKKDVQNQKI